MHSVTSNAVAGAITKVSNLQSPIAITFDRTLHLNDWQRVFDISSVDGGQGFNAILSVSCHNASHVENACFLLNITLIHFNIINLSDKPHYSPTSIRVTSTDIYPYNVKIDVLCGGHDAYQTYKFTLINLGGILNVGNNYALGNYSELEHTETLTVG